MIDYIKKTYLEYKEKKASDKIARDKMFARFDASPYIRKGFTKGESLDIQTSNGVINYMYLYSLLDDDYLLTTDLQIVAINQKYIKDNG